MRVQRESVHTSVYRRPLNPATRALVRTTSQSYMDLLPITWSVLSCGNYPPPPRSVSVIFVCLYMNYGILIIRYFYSQTVEIYLCVIYVWLYMSWMILYFILSWWCGLGQRSRYHVNRADVASSRWHCRRSTNLLYWAGPSGALYIVHCFIFHKRVIYFCIL